MEDPFDVRLLFPPEQSRPLSDVSVVSLKPHFESWRRQCAWRREREGYIATSLLNPKRLWKVPIPLNWEKGQKVTVPHPDDPTRGIDILIPEFGVAGGQVELEVPDLS